VSGIGGSKQRKEKKGRRGGGGGIRRRSFPQFVFLLFPPALPIPTSPAGGRKKLEGKKERGGKNRPECLPCVGAAGWERGGGLRGRGEKEPCRVAGFTLFSGLACRAANHKAEEEKNRPRPRQRLAALLSLRRRRHRKAFSKRGREKKRKIANLVRSSAVVNTPSFPSTPPMREGEGEGRKNARKRKDGRRSVSVAGCLNLFSLLPDGLKMFVGGKERTAAKKKKEKKKMKRRRL